MKILHAKRRRCPERANSLGRACLLVSVIIAALAVFAPRTSARPRESGNAATRSSDLLVLVSGGGNPLSNQYSQYLQARVLAGWLQKNHQRDRVSVFFGAGNTRPGDGFPDVHAVEQRQGREVHRFLPGAIEGSSSASRTNILKYFSRRDIRRSTGNLFLFVGDHGIPGQGYRNNCIVLWSREMDGSALKENCLSVSDMRRLLQKTAVRRTVFAMSQCYSGGFHQLSVGRGPDGLPVANPRVCGFTSTTHRRIASGCTPDVDSIRYQGYERTLTEQITRTDIVSGRGLGGKAPTNLKTAHRLAALRDFTIDIPLSTSEYYLLEWAQAIGRRGFAPRGPRIGAGEAVRVAQNAALGRMDRSAMLKMAGRLWGPTADLIAYIRDLERALNRVDRGLRAGARNQLALKQRMKRLDGLLANVHEAAQRDQRRYASLLRGRVHPAWSRAVENGATALGTEATRVFEPPLLEAGIRAGNRASWEQLVEQHFLVRLHALTMQDPKAAVRYSDYFADREAQILDWAETGNNLGLGPTVRELRALARRIADLQDRAYRLGQKKAIALRLYSMRSALGALVSLGAMEDKQAIDDIRGLQSCETAPLPTTKRRPTR